MGKIGIFYGSTGGVTAEVAEAIKSEFGEGDVHEVDSGIANQIADYSVVLLGTSTWGEGELQDDWEDFIDELDDADFSDKKIALFGTGDQDGYPDTFVDGMGTIYERVTANGGTVIGYWPTEGYEYDGSTAEIDGRFVGLVIDEDNQADLTSDRVKRWVDILKQEI